MLSYHITSGVVLALIWLIVNTKSSGSSMRVTRGEHDSIWYGNDYHKMVNYTDKSTLDCDEERKICQCNGAGGYNTLIYNENTKQVKCVQDDSKVLDVIGDDDGMYLQTKSEEKCLSAGKSDGKIHVVKCIKNDLSVQWLWFAIAHLLNLKTLKCLQWNNASQKFTTEQCKETELTQQWSRHKNGNGLMIKHTRFRIEPLYSNKSIYSYLYKGCYRIAGNKFIGVVKKSPHCKRTSQKRCSISITVNAPIFYEKTSRCNILWKKSKYSVYGQAWKSILSSDTIVKLFTLKRTNNESITLTISNMELFERWSGTLIKLRVKCSATNENCVFLKIEGSTRKNKTRIMTSSVVTSSPTSYLTSSPIKKNKMPSTLFVVPVVALLCLVIAALTVLYYRRRRKRINSKKDHDAYEETTARNQMMVYEDPAEIAEMQRIGPNTYESPGINTAAGNHYEYPTNGPTQQNSRQNPLNNNDFQYDYATREETSLLPLLLKGDVILEGDTFGTADNSSGTPKPREQRDSHSEKSRETPIYHTLEEDISDLPHSHKEPDTHAGHSREQPLYHTLENSNENVDNSGSQ